MRSTQVEGRDIVILVALIILTMPIIAVDMEINNLVSFQRRCVIVTHRCLMNTSVVPPS